MAELVLFARSGDNGLCVGARASPLRLAFRGGCFLLLDAWDLGPAPPRLTIQEFAFIQSLSFRVCLGPLSHREEHDERKARTCQNPRGRLG